MKSKTTLYRVYSRKGEYHHAYNPSLDGALGWAIDCAKRINGSVVEVFENGDEKEVFACQKKNKEEKCSR
tara:strand:+ start:437 stop:646 length:210 start_codon:yes stop_codon:yes gene_type:complete